MILKKKSLKLMKLNLFSVPLSMTQGSKYRNTMEKDCFRLYQSCFSFFADAVIVLTPPPGFITISLIFQFTSIHLMFLLSPQGRMGKLPKCFRPQDYEHCYNKQIEGKGKTKEVMTRLSSLKQSCCRGKEPFKLRGKWGRCIHKAQQTFILP